MMVTLGEQYHVGEKSTVMLNTYIIILYRNSAINPYTIRAHSLEHKKCYNIVIGKDKYIYVLQVLRGFLLRAFFVLFHRSKIYNLFMAFKWVPQW